MSQQEKARAWEYEYLKDNYDKIYDHMFIRDFEYDSGTWATKGSNIYPGATWNLTELTGSGDHFNDSSDRNRALVTFDYDWALHEKTYKVSLTLDRMENAYADDAGGNAEWFFDHSSAVLDESGNPSSRVSEEYPKRKDYYDLDEDGDSHSIDYSYKDAYVRPNQAAGFITRGYEEDNHRLEGIDIDELVRTWCDLWYDIGSAMITKKFKEVAQDVISIIYKAIFGNEDDPMNPCVSVFTYDFIDGIARHYDGVFKFKRIVKGLKTYDHAIAYAPEGGMPYSYAQIADIENSRGYELLYTLRVTAV